MITRSAVTSAKPPDTKTWCSSRPWRYVTSPARERGQERRVPRQHPEVALGAGRHDLVDLGGHEEAARRRQLEQHAQASRILRAFSTTSSMPPTM